MKNNTKNDKFFIYKYEGEIRDLLLKYKFNDKAYLSNFFAQKISKNEDAIKFIKKYDVIIPVPLHKKRFEERGYNQSELIIKKVIINKKIVDNVENNALKKIKNLKPQSKNGLNDRMNEIKGAYFVENNERIKNKKILLFDDIYTTGSTAKECKKILINSGVKEVGIMTIARDFLTKEVS